MESVDAETSVSQPVVISDAGAPAPAAAERQAANGVLFDYVESFLVTILLALFGTTFIVQVAFKIPSQPPMEPTLLLVGDHLLVNKFVFEAPGRLVRTAAVPYRPISAWRHCNGVQISL